MKKNFFARIIKNAELDANTRPPLSFELTKFESDIDLQYI